jgi:hypothetical protein
MRIPAMMTMLAVIGTVAQAKGSSGAQPSLVTVYMQIDWAGGKFRPIYAKSLASEMFAKASVRIRWRMGPPKRKQDVLPILIEITSKTPTTLLPGALGYAQVYEGIHIRIFGDRVENAGGVNLTDRLLAHVLVHEITHILEGVPHHSQDGVMKAHWTAHDLVRMSSRPLPFDPDDVALIHYGLAHYCLAGEMARSKTCSPAQHQLAQRQPAAILAN